MLGNDVVDLGDPEIRTRHPGFDARVFAPAERAQLRASAAPERLRWLLWSAKEAAYKAARRRDPGVGFSPRRFEVALAPGATPDGGRWRGEVRHGGLRYPVCVSVRGELVHAVAREAAAPSRGILWRAAPCRPGADASRAVRHLVARTLAPRLGDLCVARDGRIPSLRLPDGRSLALSLSHHGRFVAFACEARAAA